MKKHHWLDHHEPNKVINKPDIPLKLMWIDLMKGVAILVIVAFHFFQIYPDRFPLIVMGDHLGAQLGFICVDLFFALAGFNLTLSFLQRQGVSTLADIHVNWRQWLTQRF